MGISAGRKMDLVNEELKRVAPGWHVRSNEFGPLEYELVDPSGIPGYSRKDLDVIVILAFGREKGEAFLKKLAETPV
jgi:hypothetical protein